MQRRNSVVAESVSRRESLVGSVVEEKEGKEKVLAAAGVLVEEEESEAEFEDEEEELEEVQSLAVPLSPASKDKNAFRRRLKLE